MTCPKCNSKYRPIMIDETTNIYIDVFECGSTMDHGQLNPIQTKVYTSIFADPLFTQSDRCKSIVRGIKLNELIND